MARNRPNPSAPTRQVSPRQHADHEPAAAPKVTLDELRQELTQIRDQGWALQDEELAHGLRSVAGPITGPDGRVIAGVNLALQARDWSTRRIVRELKPVVLATYAEISQLASAGSAGA